MDWNTYWSIVLAVIVIGIIYVIILENRNPHKAVGWLIVLVLLPGVGVILYALFGREKRKIRKIDRQFLYKSDYKDTQRNTDTYPDDYVSHHPSSYSLLSNLVWDESMGGRLEAQEIAVFTNGIDKIESLIEDINNAKQYVHIQYYRFLDDKTGVLVSNALKKKAEEGVKVRLLCDYVGSFTARNSFFKDLIRHGVEVRLFLKVFFPALQSDINFRNHRKVIVIDNAIGYIGGMNIADHYTFGNNRGCWRDTHFRVTGAAVNGFQASFMADWFLASKISLSYRYFSSNTNQVEIPNTNFSPAYLKVPKVKNVEVQTFTSGPTDMFRTLLQALCRGIYEAKKSILLETPYFLPTEALNKAIIGAALSGVEVVLVVPWNNDTLAVKYAAQSYYEELLIAGVKIYRCDGEFNHSKLMTIDGEISFIGSANMDFRSIEHNFEITSIIYSSNFTKCIEAVIQDDINRSGKPFILSKWKKRSLPLRFTQSFFRLFSPLM